MLGALAIGGGLMVAAGTIAGYNILPVKTIVFAGWTLAAFHVLTREKA